MDGPTQKAIPADIFENVSVIIPAYNASHTIGLCLDALIPQSETLRSLEVIVVDDGSTDNTRNIVKGYPDVRLISQENQGPAKARNRGVSEAIGEIILFLDADCEPFPDWAQQMIRPFREQHGVIGVKGAYRTKQKELVAKFVQYEYESKYDKMMKRKYIDFIDTYSAAFKKDIFLAFSGYDAAFPVACAEDVELSYRLSRAGYKMVFNPNAKTYHRHPSSLSDYLKKKYKFSYWRMLALRKNPEKIVADSHTPQTMKLQLLLSPIIVSSLLLQPIISSMRIITIFSFIIFTIISMSFMLETFKKDKVIGLASPFLLILRGMSQFVGVLSGLAKFFLRDTLTRASV